MSTNKYKIVKKFEKNCNKTNKLIINNYEMLEWNLKCLNYEYGQLNLKKWRKKKKRIEKEIKRKNPDCIFIDWT